MTHKPSSFQPHGLRSLRAYQLARQLAHMVYEATGGFLQSKYNHTWNTLGALGRSLREKKLDGSWDRTYTTREREELYNV